MASPVRMEVKVIRNDFPAIPGRMQRAAGKRIHAAGFRVQGGAQMRSRVDLGTMRAGWLNRPSGPLTTIIANPVGHTIYNEFGTRKMSAQPMIRPEMEAEPPRLIASFQGIEGELAA